MEEMEVRFPSGEVVLAGTLTAPARDGRYPCVLLVPGSGQVDRNENHRKLQINALREIAEHLARDGIATLRYDKRGVGASGGDFWTTGLYDNARDVRAGLSFLRSRDDVDPEQVFLLGHSEGAIIAAHLAGQQERLAGLILIAGSARTGEEVMIWQGQQISRSLTGFNGWLIRLLHIDVTKAQRKNLVKLKATKEDVARMQLIAKVNAKWMREFLAYDPSEDLERIQVPVLAVTGSDDIQTDPADIERMRELVHAPFEAHVIAGVSHILRDTHGKPGLSTYREQASRPVDPQVLSTIGTWLGRRITPVSAA